MQKQSTIGYFKYFNKIASGRLIPYILLNFAVGFLDGIGLTMFIPLIYVVTESSGGDSLGKLGFILDAFAQLHIPLNLFTILAFMVIIFIIKGILAYIRTLYFVKTQQIAAKKMRLMLVDGLRDLSYQGFTSIDSGRVQNTMTTEASRFFSAITNYLGSIQNISMLLIYVVLAFFTNWQFAILVGFGSLLTSFAYKYINIATKREASKIAALGRSFHGFLVQLLYNFKYLKATGQSEIYSNKLKYEIEHKEDVQYRLGRIYAIAENLREPMIIMIIAIVIFVQIQILDGEMGSMMAALLLFYRSLNHLANFQSLSNKFLADIHGMHSIEEILLDFINYTDYNKDGKEIDQLGEIQIKNLNFGYGDTQILKNIHLQIQPKTSIAFVGESGAGKTTLANIICGLIIPEEGQLTYGNSNVNELDLMSLRSKVGYVTQEAVIFDDTLFNNVSFFAEKNEENLTRFWKAIEMASLTEFVQSHQKKEDIPLGSNGILVSGGQKQRISIARELYKDIELMIMDEATSALDSATEKYIKDQIDELHGKFTLVIIAHRLSTIKNVDIIYLMEDGEIISSGNYDELYEKSLIFRQMVDLQNLQITSTN